MGGGYKVLMTLMRLEIGGAETHVLELCKALKKRGVDVCVASNGGVYVEELRQSGIPHFKVPLHNKRLRNMAASYRLLKKIIRENGIRLVHAHGRIPAFICGLLQRRLGFRFVTTTHLNFKTNFPYNILSDWGEKSLAVSPDIKGYLIQNYKMSPGDIFVTVNGVDTDKFSPDTPFGDIMAEFGLNEGTLKIVSTSRIDPDRSLAARLLIECAPRLCAHTPGIEIIIVGGGTDLERVRGEAGAVNRSLGRRLITVTGSRADVNKFVAMADIYVNVSRGVMEAMASSRASIVAGNQGYIGIFDKDKLDICRETNFCCRGCADTSAELLYADLIKLIEMGAEKRAELGAYGRGAILAEYSVGRMAEDALAMYGTLGRLDAPRPEDILISGYYGFRNNGDEAVLKAIVDSLRAKDPSLRICALSMRPGLTRRLHGIRAVNRYNLPMICRELSRTALLLTGGGSLIQDVTSTRSLLYYLFIISLAMKFGAKNMLFANGIGPLKQPRNRAMAGRMLNKVDLITVRDGLSAQVLHEIGVDAPPVELAADIAFALSHGDTSAGERRLKALGVTGGYFCIAIRSWKSLKPGFEAQIAAFADYVSGAHGLVPVFIPMQPANDEDISRRALALMKAPGCFLGAPYELGEILGVISGAAFALCMRLHTVVYSLCYGTPAIGLVYDPKVRSMMEFSGQGTFMDADGIDPEKLIAFADGIMANRGEISESVLRVSRAAGEKALRSTELAVGLLKG